MLLLLAVTVQALNPQPIEARVVEISRPQHPIVDGTSYERVKLELINRGDKAVTFNLCPSDARFTNFVARADKVKAYDDGRAFAASAGRERSWRSRCRALSIAPSVAQTVTYYVRGGAFGQGRRLTLATNVGTFIYTSGVSLATR